MTQEAAETLALNVLVWLVGNEEILPVFMGASGIGEDDLRARAGEPEFLAAVLDFVTMNDEWVNDCAQAAGLNPVDFLPARAALPGGQQIHWT